MSSLNKILPYEIDEEEDKTVTIRDVLDYVELVGEEECQKRELRKNESLVRALGKDQIFFRQLDQTLTKVFRNKIVLAKTPPKLKHPTERQNHVIISDLHLHSLLNGVETSTKYMEVEESRSLAAVCLQVCEFKRQYRKNSRLVMHVLGDIIAGKIHDAQAHAPLALQVAAAIDMLIKAVAYCAQEFSEVEVFCVSGNHGRNPQRHDVRAVDQKWDSIETMIYYGLKKGVAHIKHVSVEIPYSPYYGCKWNGFDEGIFATHGDTVINAGNPGKAINIQNIRKQTDAINESVVFDGVKGKCGLFLVGHVHTGNVTILPTGARFVSNGTLMPPDAFAESMGYFTNVCGQWIFEAVPGFLFGDSRFVTVDDKIRKDKSLDKVIAPFEGLNG